MNVKRIDPPDCGCTDCITGYSKPINNMNQNELAIAFYTPLPNVSGFRITRNETIIYKYLEDYK